MSNADPAPQPQLALPVDTIEAAAKMGTHPLAPPLLQATCDLIVIAFFYLLRVGEYTMPAANRQTRTVQFRLQDVRFYKNGRLLAHTAPLHELSTADHVALTIDNQKNGQRGATINHFRVPNSPLDPVACLARRVKAISAHNLPLSTPLSYVSPGIHVTAPQVLKVVRLAALQSNLPAKGYNLHRVGAHSLRASGAMALKLNGYAAEDIMKIGRWRGTTYLTYIHSQIAALTKGISIKMTRRISFTNVAA